MSRPGIDASAFRSLPDIVPGAEPRLLAARLVESTLLRLGRAGVVIERRLVPGLSRLHRRRLYTHLGYVRLADYLTERLGMSLRRCQAILRLERALAPLPRLARALQAGELSVSKLEVAAAAATPETEAMWLDRARKLPLPSLRAAARALALADATTTIGHDASATGDGASATCGDTSASGGATSAIGDDASAIGPGASPAPAGPLANASPLIEQDDPGRVISFSAPAPVVAIWHWTLDLVRRVAGQQEPAWRCAEFLAAEFLSGAPDTAGESPRGPSDSAPSPSDSASAPAPGADAPMSDPDATDPEAGAPKPGPDPAKPDATAPGPRRRAGPAPFASDDRGSSAWLEATAVVREALASIGASADPETILSESPPVGQGPDSEAEKPPVDREPDAEAESPRAGRGPDSDAESHSDDELDAWDLDAHLRRLVRLRQSLAWRQGRLLAAVVRLNLHHDLGFDTFDAWGEDRLAMSPRRARYLVSLDRRLRDLPLLADAYRRGLVSWCQARLLIRVVRPPTQSRWIRYARQVTVRRLEDVIIDCEVRAAESPATPASSSPAHISAWPLPPTESCPTEPPAAVLSPIGPPPADPSRTGPPAADPTFASPDFADPSPAEAAPMPSHPTPRHTSAPPLDLASMKAASLNRRTWRRISFWCPLDVASLWDSALRSCRAAAGRDLEAWECFLLFVQAMRETWENQEDPHWRRRYRIFERDGWRCKAPGCTSRSGLNEHHIIFRSQQGGNDASNLLTMCILCRARHKMHYADLRIMPTSLLRAWRVAGNVIQYAA